jgi:hypothetical protein
VTYDPLAPDYLDRPAPDPAVFGLPDAFAATLRTVLAG